MHARQLETPESFSHVEFLDGPATIHSSRTHIWCHTKRQPKRIDASREINEKNIRIVHIVFSGPGLQSSLPSNIFSCLYSIAVWSEFFEPCNLETLRVSADPLALKGPKILVKRPRIMKSIMFPCMLVALYQPNLSHMDFLDGPAAIHSSTTTYSRTTKSPSPNEYSDPEISMKKTSELYI